MRAERLQDDERQQIEGDVAYHGLIDAGLIRCQAYERLTIAEDGFVSPSTPL